jgi:hypothetical protein
VSRTVRLLIIVIAGVAVLAAGTATAAKLITGKDIRDASLTGDDVKPRSLDADLFTDETRQSLHGRRGKRGPQGPSAAYVARGTGRKQILNQEDRALLTKVVPAGPYTIMGKAVLLNTGGANASPNCQLVISSGGRFQALDQVNDVPLGAEGAPTDSAEVVVMGFARLAGDANSVQLRCTPGKGETFVARDRVLLATQTGELR